MKLIFRKINFTLGSVFLLLVLVLPISSHNIAPVRIGYHYAGILIPLYSGPSYDQKDWDNILWASREKIPLAVIVNPNNGPGTHLHSDYLSIIGLLKRAGNKALGYIPTDYAKTPLPQVRNDISLYINEYKVNGIFLDEMADVYSKKNFLYYKHIVLYARKLAPNLTIFANPGINFAQRFLATGINTFVDEEDSAVAVNKNIQSPWVTNYPDGRFAQIAIAAKNNVSEIGYLLSRHHIGWVYSTTYALHSYDNNPYAHLPADFRKEVLYVKKLNENQ
jgi:hypothetical protein